MTTKDQPKTARRVSTRRSANQSNYTTWKLPRINLAICGIDANLGPSNAHTFRHDLHPELNAKFILVTATRDLPLLRLLSGQLESLVCPTE